MSLLAKDGTAVFMAITPSERGYRTEHGGRDRIAPMPAYCINVSEN